MTCTNFEELSGAYILDSITPEERRAAEEHLAHCSRCTRLVKELNSIIELLPLSVPSVEPSPELKDRVLAAIYAREGTSPQSTLPMKVRQTRPPQQQARPRRRLGSGWGTQLVAAAAILLFVLSSGMATWNVSLQHQNATLQQQNHTLQRQVIVLTNKIQGEAMAPEAQGQLLYIPDQNITVLIMRGLPQAHNKVYQGWLLKGKQPISIGLLAVHDGVATLDFPNNAHGFDAVAVSQEDTPGPSAKPSNVVATGELSHSV